MKNKGFTLIELLAIIVILAIIALIAIPMISRIVDKTEDSASVRSAELYIDGVNQAIMRENLNGKFRPKECIIQSDGNIICDGKTEIKIEATGTKPKKGILIIEDRKVVSFTEMVIDKYELETDEKGKVIIKGIVEEPNYVDSTGVEAELYKDLTPVIYEDNTWKIANRKEQWYDYANQEWANTVILKDKVIKKVGDTIDVSSEVKAMFVWIPRYEYKIEGTYGKGGTAAATPGEIEINLISKETTVPSSGYRIHPAFTFDDIELSGMWVGKFETTGSTEEPTILPNLTSLRNQNISTQFTTAKKFSFYLSKANVGSHLLKNSEWGAIAYLSQSKYGKYGNSNYTGADKQVMINNCSDFITGIAANVQNEKASTATCTTNTYETIKGQAASTTGNITGVYDMSGGAWEYVMGYLTIASSIWGAASTGNTSGFSGPLQEKYYDNYTSTTTTTACGKGICYGHALSETSGWYGDLADFATIEYPWLTRGGNIIDTSNAGVYRTGHCGGYASDDITFRVVIVSE